MSTTANSTSANCSPIKHSSKISNNFYFDLMAELIAEDFELPEGVLDYKAGWCLALPTSMTFTCLIPTDSTWSEEEFLYIQLF